MSAIFIPGVMRGIIAFITTAALGGVCLVFGFSPDTWVEMVITSPPWWLSHPLTRIGAIVLGGLFGWWTWKLFQRWRSVLPIDVATTEQRAGKISIMELRKEAEKKYDWDFSSAVNTHILGFTFGLRESGVAGDLEFWGRSNRNMFDSLTRGEPLQKIDQDHWIEFEIDGLFSLHETDNLKIVSRPSKGENKPGYADIYVDRSPAIKWLKNTAGEYMRYKDKRYKHQ